MEQKFILIIDGTDYIFKLSNSDEGYRDYTKLDSLRNLAKSEYYQFLNQHKTCLDIAIEIDSKQFSIGVLDSKFIAAALKNNIANYLCNVNCRIILANNLLQRNNLKTLSFKDSYKGCLKLNGLMSTIDSCNTDLYRAFFEFYAKEYSVTVKYSVKQTESNFIDFFKTYNNLPVRVWTQNTNSKSDTHATLLYYDSQTDKIFAIDTASRERNNLEFTDIQKGLIYNRKILHLEALI